MIVIDSLTLGILIWLSVLGTAAVFVYQVALLARDLRRWRSHSG